MKIPALLSAAFAACLVPYTTLHAQEVEYGAIEEKNLISGKQALDPQKAYIFIRAPNRSNGLFIKSPDEEDIAEYREYWDERMEKAKKRFTSRKSRYDRDYASWKKNPQRQAKPLQPIEPTPANLDVKPIEQFMLVSFGPQYIYSKDTEDKSNKEFTYLIEVEPAEYSYYGPIFHIPNGQTIGTCFCMGTVRFEAKAGEVTSLGDLLSMGWADDETMAQAIIPIVEIKRGEPKPIDWSVPQLLADFGSVPADLRAARKINNFFGILIARMPPVEGVLAYDRDRILDLRGAKTDDEPALPMVENGIVPDAIGGERDSSAGDRLEEEVSEGSAAN